MIALGDLIAPLDAAEFVARHWLPERAHLSAPSARLMEGLRSIALLRDLDALLAKRGGSAVLFGADHFRGHAKAEEAREAMRAGRTLYLTGIERVVPEARDLLYRAAEELGVPEHALSLQMFVAGAGAISSVHYDHDINFQILLEGEKDWLIAPNRHIVNPLVAYHPAPGGDGEDTSFTEEVFARDRRMPTAMPEDAVRLHATAGTVMFLPRGHWHEVRTVAPSIAISLVIAGSNWATAIAEGLRLRMVRHEGARAWVGGIVGAIDTVRAEERARFEAARDEAMRELAALTFDEVLLSRPLRTWAWTERARGRRMEEEDGVSYLVVDDEAIELEPEAVSLVRELVALRRRFSWNHVLALVGPAIADTLPAHVVLNLIDALVEEDLLAP